MFQKVACIVQAKRGEFELFGMSQKMAQIA